VTSNPLSLDNGSREPVKALPNPRDFLLTHQSNCMESAFEQL